MSGRLFTWDEIDDPKVVNYRDRGAAIHARLLADCRYYRAVSEYWDKVRASIAANGLPADHTPPLTLAEQADRQIAILERDLAEWRKIKEGGAA